MKKSMKEIKKRVMAIILATGMVMSLAACGSDSDAPGQNGSVTENNTTGNENSSNENTANGENSTGADDNSAGSGATVDNTVSIDAIHTAVKEAYGENYLPNMLLSEDDIQLTLGIEPSWYEEIIVELPMISAQVDTFIAVKATDDHVADVTDAITAYQERLKADTMQYPSNLSKIAASTVVTMDNYIFFIMLGYVDISIEDQPEDVRIQAHTEQNQIAIDAIESVLLK